MVELEGELAVALRKYRAARQSADHEVRAWRHGMMQEISRIEAASKAAQKASRGRPPALAEPPADAPPAYRRVREKVERGWLSWSDVVIGTTDDRDGLVVHRWLAHRIDWASEMLRAEAAEAAGRREDEA